MQGNPAPDELSAALVARVEDLARRLGCDRGERTLEFVLVNGKLRRTHLHAGPIKNDELETVARAVGFLTGRRAIV